jgi:hypothetical protein
MLGPPQIHERLHRRPARCGTAKIGAVIQQCWQRHPDALLPEVLQNANPLGIRRLVDGEVSQSAL